LAETLTSKGGKTGRSSLTLVVAVLTSAGAGVTIGLVSSSATTGLIGLELSSGWGDRVVVDELLVSDIWVDKTTLSIESVASALFIISSLSSFFDSSSPWGVGGEDMAMGALAISGAAIMELR